MRSKRSTLANLTSRPSWPLDCWLEALLAQREAKVQAGLIYRERQLLDHITKGGTNQEIGDRLGTDRRNN